ncbi:carbohydrate ABC transporter permease [Blautia schinkii]|nr:carbohydrate ABC transporter permease [Blautia schinkii]
MVDNKKGFHITINLVMIILSLCCLLPFVLLVVSSFTEEAALIRDGYSFLPKAFSLDAYRYIFTGSAKILRGYGITIFISVAGTAAGILMTILLAYPLSRKELPGRNVISFFIFFTMLFNGGLVPSYMIWSNTFHIRDTIWALLLPNLLMNAFNIIMMRNYLKANVPDEIIEAAKIDGAGEFKILFKVVFPMSVPMVATLGLMVGLGYWNDWQNGLYYIAGRTDLYSIQNILNRMLQDAQFIASGQAGGNVGEMAASLPSVGIKMAIAVAGILPVLMIYPFVQRYLVKGITIGAVKG